MAAVTAESRKQWEGAAPGWARWEPTIAAWMEPATEAMLSMAGVTSGSKVLDIACGAGSQTLSAARLVGSRGHIVASDIADTMLQHVRENARAAGLSNISTLRGAAEELELEAGSFDAAICRLGLMLFADPGKVLRAAHGALQPGGKVAAVVFTTPPANPFMAKPMQILLRHAGKAPPAPGQPGIFSLGAPDLLERLFAESGFAELDKQVLSLELCMPSAADALTMMQEAFGAYRAVVSDRSEGVRRAAWADVSKELAKFDGQAGFVAPAEVLVAGGVKRAS